MRHAHDRLNEERRQAGSWTVGREKEKKNVGPAHERERKSKGREGSSLGKRDRPGQPVWSKKWEKEMKGRKRDWACELGHWAPFGLIFLFLFLALFNLIQAIHLLLIFSNFLNPTQ